MDRSAQALYLLVAVIRPGPRMLRSITSLRVGVEASRPGRRSSYGNSCVFLAFRGLVSRKRESFFSFFLYKGSCTIAAQILFLCCVPLKFAAYYGLYAYLQMMTMKRFTWSSGISTACNKMASLCEKGYIRAHALRQ